MATTKYYEVVYKDGSSAFEPEDYHEKNYGKATWDNILNGTDSQGRRAVFIAEGDPDDEDFLYALEEGELG